MNSQEEIKQLLAKKDFSAALLVAFSNSLKFKLTSIKTDTDKDTQESVEFIETQINLLKGLTTTASNSEILSSKNDLTKFHTQQLGNVYQVWQKNREVLVKILEILAGNNLKDIPLTKSVSFEFNKSNLIEKSETQDSEIIDFDLAEDNDDENWLDENKEQINSPIDSDNEMLLDEIIVEEENEIILDALDEDENEMIILDTINDEDENEIILDTIDENENEIILDTIDEESVVISDEQQQQTEESWDEFMGDLSAEEEAVSEEIVVEEVTDDEEIGDDWSEWLSDEDENVSSIEFSNENGAIDWEKEEEDKLTVDN